MSYVEDCVKDHVEGMKNREVTMRIEIKVKTAELQLLESERRNLENGIDNWIEESKDN